MLNEWQTILLDHGLWALPLSAAVTLALFPWRHWNAVLDRIEDNG